MNHPSPLLLRTTLGLLVGLTWLVSPLVAQEEEPQEDDDRPLISEDLFGGQGDPNEELKRLFHEVETKLVEIDIQLADAGAGDIPLSEVGSSGLEKLLRDSQARSREVLSGIDKILELAEQMGQQQGQGGGQGQQPKPGGESPLDQPRDSGPQGREKTPEGPGENQQPGEEQGEQPEEGGEKPGEKPGGEQPQDGEDPNSPGKGPEEGENRDGKPQDAESGPGIPRAEDANRWGELPQRVQETFRNQGRDDLPLQYRDWIDSYYRRLNKAR